MEGPSVHRIADRLQRLAGQEVRWVAGNARQPLDRLEGTRLDAVDAVKKRLVLTTSDAGDPGPAVLVHFYMWGTWRLNEHRDQPPRLSMDLAEDTLNIYNGSVKVVDPPALAERLDPTGDVLRSRFDADRARAALREDRLVADVLLDQRVLGGVGNILKNEALFRVGVHPRRSAAGLCRFEREALLDAAVTLTREWYEDGDWRGLQAIYRASDCPTCGRDTEGAEVGEYDRITNWCARCQPREGRLRAPPTPAGRRLGAGDPRPPPAEARGLDEAWTRPP